MRWKAPAWCAIFVTACSGGGGGVDASVDGFLGDGAGADGALDAGAPDSGGELDAALPPGMVLIPAGTFWMGCNSKVDFQCLGAEYPYHAVSLSTYAIDATEVTQAAWRECVDAGGCALPDQNGECAGNFDPDARGQYPVTCVTWTQARDYCVWRGYRLPSEAEWERAARGEDGRIYPWGNNFPNCILANNAVDFGCDAVEPVGSHPAGASPHGLLDVASNVREFVNDYYDSGYYSESPGMDPPGPATGTERVTRGAGADAFEYHFLRTSERWSDVSAPQPMMGLRCAASL